jgi:hypothetical protein
LTEYHGSLPAPWKVGRGAGRYRVRVVFGRLREPLSEEGMYGGDEFQSLREVAVHDLAEIYGFKPFTVAKTCKAKGSQIELHANKSIHTKFLSPFTAFMDARAVVRGARFPDLTQE